jgi:hypothetical protein
VRRADNPTTFICRLKSGSLIFLKPLGSVHACKEIALPVPSICAKHKCLSVCAERNALLGLLVNHIITLAPATIKKKSHEPPLMLDEYHRTVNFY